MEKSHSVDIDEEIDFTIAKAMLDNDKYMEEKQ